MRQSNWEGFIGRLGRTSPWTCLLLSLGGVLFPSASAAPPGSQRAAWAGPWDQIVSNSS